MKKIFKYVFVILLCVFLLVGCKEKNNNDNDNEGDKNPIVNTSEGIIKEQEVEGLKFSNIGLVYDFSKSIFRVTVTNVSDSTKYVKSFDIEISNKDGLVLETLLGFIGEDMEPNESKEIVANSDLNLTAGRTVKYIINK